MDSVSKTQTTRLALASGSGSILMDDTGTKMTTATTEMVKHRWTSDSFPLNDKSNNLVRAITTTCHLWTTILFRHQLDTNALDLFLWVVRGRASARVTWLLEVHTGRITTICHLWKTILG